MLLYKRVCLSAYLLVLWYALSGMAHALIVPPSGDYRQNTVAYEIQHTLQSLALLSSGQPKNLPSLQSFYQRRGYQAAWCSSFGLSTIAERWLSILEEVEQEGVDGATVHLDEIRQRLDAVGASELAELDLLLSNAFFQYATIMGRGQLEPSLVDPKWHIPLPEVKPVALLEQALQSGAIEEVIASLVPNHPSYRQLRDALAAYVLIEELGGWPVLPAAGPKLEPGSESDEIQILRERLWISGDLGEEGTQGTVYDKGLEEAVTRFQKRHGLQADGIVGRRTRAALAVPVEQRVLQIRVNLERWRWLPRDLGQRYITVNTAGFELKVHEQDAVPLSMRVIVGKKRRETPVFTEQLRYLVVNPYWRVPTKLAKRDLIPAQLRDPDYFTRKGIRVLSDWKADASELDPAEIDWQDYLGRRYLPYQLRQDPGPENSLGRIKFMLPNPYSVYLHDTPAKHLFNKPVRTFSSGCIRVEKPLALANYVLAGQGYREPPPIEAIIDRGDTRIVPLADPVPVYVLYHTAWVDGDARVHFREDIYRRDQKLAALLHLESAPEKGDQYAKKTTVHDVSRPRPPDLSLVGDR